MFEHCSLPSIFSLLLHRVVEHHLDMEFRIGRICPNNPKSVMILVDGCHELVAAEKVDVMGQLLGCSSRKNEFRFLELDRRVVECAAVFEDDVLRSVSRLVDDDCLSC